MEHDIPSKKQSGPYAESTLPLPFFLKYAIKKNKVKLKNIKP